MLASLLVLIGRPVGLEALPTALEKGAGDLLRSAVDQMGQKFDGTVAVFHVDENGQSSKLADDLPGLVAKQLQAGYGVRILDAEDAQNALNQLWMGVNDLMTAKAAAEFCRVSGADWLVLIDHRIQARQVYLELTVNRRGVEDDLARVDLNVDKDDSTLEYLNEPVPGRLSIRAPTDSRVYVDGDPQGSGGGTPIRVRLSAGLHNVRVVKDGYAPKTVQLHIHDRENSFLKVKEKRNTGAPILAMLASAVVPGAGALAYGDPQAEESSRIYTAESFVYVPAAVFYVSGGMYLFDSLSSHTFMTRHDEDKYNQHRNTELYIAAAGYAVNVIASIVVGAEYAKRNRELTVSTRQKAELRGREAPNHGRIGFGLNRSGGDPQLAMVWSASF